MVTGRNGSPALNRAPNGCSTSSTNWRVLGYFLETADLPVISQVMSSAKMLVTYPVPFIHAAKASVTISRSEGIWVLFLTRTWLKFVYVQAGWRDRPSPR